MSRASKVRSGVRVGYASDAGELVRFAAHELAAGLCAMLGEAPRVEAGNGLDARSLTVEAEAAALCAAASASTDIRPAAESRDAALSSGSAAR